MCKPTCPFAAALFGSIAGSAAGAASGAVSGWTLYAAYAISGGRDVGGLVPLIFGTLGMAVGGSGGAVGGMVQGWSLAGSKGPAEASAARWGAGLGGLWSLQPILWLAFTVDPATALRPAAGVAIALVALGGVAGLIGAATAGSVVRAFVVARPPEVPAGKRRG